MTDREARARVTIEERIAELVAEAPPLSEGQIDRLQRIIAPALERRRARSVRTVRNPPVI